MSSADTISAFVLDGHEAYRAGVRAILTAAGINVVGEADTVSECMCLQASVRIDVYVVGFNVKDAPGVVAIELLRERNQHVRIVAFGSGGDIQTVCDAYEAGASSYVPESGASDDVVASVQAVATVDKPHFAPGVAEALATFYTSGARSLEPRSLLTARELTIFTLLAEGRTQREVATMLEVSEKSVGNRAVTIRRKLGVPRSQFTSIAIRHRLIDASGQAPSH